MERTLHHSATVFVVHEGAVLLHDHDTREHWLPPAGHLRRGELPHDGGLREVREETGLDVELVAETDDVETPPTVESLPRPRHFRAVDIDTCGDEVVHQHLDLAFYARAPHRSLEPREGEVPPARWEWFTADELDADDRVRPYEARIGRRAIAVVSG